MPSTLRLFLIAVAIAALALRLAFLDTLPGVNGDEAWYGLWVLRCVHEGVCPLRTPSGNLVNPFYMVLVAIFQTVIGIPSVLALRLPAVVGGLGFVAAAYGLCRAAIGRNAALIFALLAAALPIDIAYSRYGWDTAEMGLAATLVLATALRGRWLLAVLALAASLLVHPTGVFLLPIMLMLLLRETAEERRTPTRNLVLAGIFFICAAAGTAVGIGLHDKLSLGLPNPPFGASYALTVTAGIVHVFSGATIAAYLSGGNPGWGVDLFTGAVLVLAVLILARRIPADAESIETATLFGVLLSVLAFGLVGGPVALSPGWERYAMVLVAPVLLIVALALNRAAPTRPQAAVTAAALLGTVWMVSFFAAYMLAMLRSGGREADPATAGYGDPKQQAAVFLAVESAGRPSLVAGENWWITEPLLYFTYGKPPLRVIDAAAVEDWNAVTDAVTFPGSALDRRFAETRQPQHIIRDRGGRPAIDVWHLRDTVTQ
ncbi:MAG TPA: glycosyltransferase family 39 protein [Stellaceae bacterium]|nr:glycosyltransferase family 39 protein [Stellaceae bacterium]